MEASSQTSIVFVGAGNLATHLACALAKSGFAITQVYSRTAQSAQVLADKVGASWTTHLGELLPDAAIYMVSLKDDVFINLLPEIVAGRQHALFLHTAGSIPINIWKDKVERYGVFYPLQTFSKQREVDFSAIPIFLEASDAAVMHTLQQMARLISSRMYEVNSDVRRRLHLAAVFACNFTNHMYTLASDLLKQNELPFEVLLPLIDETAAKVHQLLPEKAQTGPAVRYDEGVMNKHLELLKDDDAASEIYRLLSKSIHRRGQIKN